MKKLRKGFTLIELLIVIILLGILAATMVMTSGSSVAAARANTIISNLGLIKNAALAYFTADFANKPTLNKFKKNAQTYLGKTADQNTSTENVLTLDKFTYGVHSNDPDDAATATEWWAFCDFSAFSSTPDDANELRTKLAKSAVTDQLFTSNFAEGEVYNTGDTLYKVYIRIK